MPQKIPHAGQMPLKSEKNHEKLTHRHDGHNFRLTDVHGRVIDEILA